MGYIRKELARYLAPIMDAQGPWTGTVTAVLPDWRDPNERVIVELTGRCGERTPMSETYTMPPQFPVVAEAFAPPIYRIRKALRTHHQLTGAPFLLNNFQAEWAEIISRNIDNVSAAVNQLGQKVMGPLTAMSQMNMPGKWLHPWIEPLPNTLRHRYISLPSVAGWNGAGKIIGRRHHGETPAGSSRSF